MTDDRIEGGLRRGLGRIKDVVGDLSGDARLRVEGRLDEAAGWSQELAGRGREATRVAWEEAERFTRDNPGAALAMAFAAGLVVGASLIGGARTGR